LTTLQQSFADKTTEHTEDTERETPKTRTGRLLSAFEPGRFLFQDQFTHSFSAFPCIPSIPWFTLGSVGLLF
jgi:hypothetical protein